MPRSRRAYFQRCGDAAESQLDPTGPPSCLTPAKVSIPSSCALPSFPLMTYLTIINPESNRDEPGERLMAPSARYTCSAARLPATKLWPNRRPRSPVSKINTAPSPVALGALHGGDAVTRSTATALIMLLKAGRRGPSFVVPFLSQLTTPSFFNGRTSAATQRCRWCDSLKSSSQPVSPFISADPFRRGGVGRRRGKCTFGNLAAHRCRIVDS